MIYPKRPLFRRIKDLENTIADILYNALHGGEVDAYFTTQELPWRLYVRKVGEKYSVELFLYSRLPEDMHSRGPITLIYRKNVANARELENTLSRIVHYLYENTEEVNCLVKSISAMYILNKVTQEVIGETVAYSLASLFMFVIISALGLASRNPSIALAALLGAALSSMASFIAGRGKRIIEKKTATGKSLEECIASMIKRIEKEVGLEYSGVLWGAKIYERWPTQKSL